MWTIVFNSNQWLCHLCLSPVPHETPDYCEASNSCLRNDNTEITSNLLYLFLIYDAGPACTLYFFSIS